jgi:PEP-CTERM motif-containing protein
VRGFLRLGSILVSSDEDFAGGLVPLFGEFQEIRRSGGLLSKQFISRAIKMILVLAVVLVGPGLLVASADSFNFNGTFPNPPGDPSGSALTLSGSVNINTGLSSNWITGGTLNVGSTAFTFNGTQLAIGGEYLAQFTSAGGATLDIWFPLTGLGGYTGGALCIAVNGQNSVPGCNFPTVVGDGSGGTVFLSQGSASSAVPEPSSLILLTGGLIGLGLLGRKMHFANDKA